MRCDYGDGLKVDYSGPFRITKGEEINVFVAESRLPGDIRNDLEMALFRNSCSELREVADTVTKKYGTRACIH